MDYYANLKNKSRIEGVGHYSYNLLDETNGCVNRCKTGISYYETTEYPVAGVHNEQEGFIVMEGHGWAKVGDKEFRLEPDISFIVPARVEHTIKSDSRSKPIKVFWFHSAV